jgi:hypothetical protein
MRSRKSRLRAYERRPQADTGSPHALSVAGFKIRPRTVNVTSLLRRAHLQGMVWREGRIDPPPVISVGPSASGPGLRCSRLLEFPQQLVGSIEERKTATQRGQPRERSLGISWRLHLESLATVSTTAIGETQTEWALTSCSRL